MNTKRNALWIVGMIVFGIITAAVGFYAGVTYEENLIVQRQADAQSLFLKERGQPSSQAGNPDNPAYESQMPGGRPGFGAMGGGISGQVKSIEGNVLSISTAEDVTTVNLSDSTKILMNQEVDPSKLLPGVRVMLSGEMDQDGKITNVTQITIMDDSMMFPPRSPQATAEP